MPDCPLLPGRLLCWEACSGRPWDIQAKDPEHPRPTLQAEGWGENCTSQHLEKGLSRRRSRHTAAPARGWGLTAALGRELVRTRPRPTRSRPWDRTQRRGPTWLCERPHCALPRSPRRASSRLGPPCGAPAQGLSPAACLAGFQSPSENQPVLRSRDADCSPICHTLRPALGHHQQARLCPSRRAACRGGQLRRTAGGGTPGQPGDCGPHSLLCPWTQSSTPLPSQPAQTATSHCKGLIWLPGPLVGKLGGLAAHRADLGRLPRSTWVSRRQDDTDPGAAASTAVQTGGTGSKQSWTPGRGSYRRSWSLSWSPSHPPTPNPCPQSNTNTPHTQHRSAFRGGRVYTLMFLLAAVNDGHRVSGGLSGHAAAAKPAGSRQVGESCLVGRVRALSRRVPGSA